MLAEFFFFSGNTKVETQTTISYNSGRVVKKANSGTADKDIYNFTQGSYPCSLIHAILYRTSSNVIM